MTRVLYFSISIVTFLATNETSTSRPQQVRVTLGSLPVSLGSGGLGQLFQTVLGQLGGTSKK
jgi:hypothetical protein